MRRFLTRGLVLALPLAFFAAAATPSQSAVIDPADALAPPPVTSSVRPLETANGCCWIFHAGRWYCVPCG